MRDTALSRHCDESTANIFDMSISENAVRQLDFAYKPFPSFAEFNRSVSLDSMRWDRYQAELGSFDQNPALLERAFEVATRAAALDTGAIEGLYEVDRGFTYTVAMETAAWEAALHQKGEGVRSLFEAQLSAYEYVLTLATKGEPISEAAIRALHATVCAAQDKYSVVTSTGPQQQELPKGVYKALPNHVRTRKGEDHSYAPVDMTPPEMARLVRELRTEEFLIAHPVIQAVYAHYCLVVIHPFADGNGRVARALASAFTYRAARMPIVILSEHKNAYLDCLADADEGSYQSFLDFMLARTLDTMQLVIESIKAANSPSISDAAAQIERLYMTKSGYTQDQVDAFAETFLQEVTEEFPKTLKAASVSKVQHQVSIQPQSYNVGSTAHRPPLKGFRCILLHLTSAAPANAVVHRAYGLAVPRDASSSDNIRLRNTSNNDDSDVLEARIDELHPTISGLLMMRIRMFSERVIAEIFEELRRAGEKQLRKPQ